MFVGGLQILNGLIEMFTGISPLFSLFGKPTLNTFWRWHGLWMQEYGFNESMQSQVRQAGTVRVIIALFILFLSIDINWLFNYWQMIISH